MVAPPRGALPRPARGSGQNCGAFAGQNENSKTLKRPKIFTNAYGQAGVGGDPPPLLTVSLTVKNPFWFLTTSLIKYSKKLTKLKRCVSRKHFANYSLEKMQFKSIWGISLSTQFSQPIRARCTKKRRSVVFYQTSLDPPPPVGNFSGITKVPCIMFLVFLRAILPTVRMLLSTNSIFGC